MDEQLHRKLRIGELAAAAGLSVSHLTRLFRAATGLTPLAFLQQRRMARARTLLERTTLPVAAVMAQVGVSDRSHFARDFRRAYGRTPRMLRLEQRGAPDRDPALQLADGSGDRRDGRSRADWYLRSRRRGE